MNPDINLTRGKTIPYIRKRQASIVFLTTILTDGWAISISGMTAADGSRYHIEVEDDSQI
tara:strand:+ start:586 stop:765 length:180 start_codon:yes stop_codon:yes gene_type:complete